MVALPLYSFNCDSENIDLAEGIKIQKIPSEFVHYLDKEYSHGLKTIPSTAKWIASFPHDENINKGNNFKEAFQIAYESQDKIRNLLVDLITALRLYQKGRVVTGLLTSATLNNTEWSIGGSSIWPYVSSIDFFEEEPIYEVKSGDIPLINNVLSDIRQSRLNGNIEIMDVIFRRFIPRITE